MPIVEHGGTPETADFLARAIATIGALAPPARVLDFGCGEGRLVSELGARGFETWGCDFPEQLRNAPRLCPIAREPYRLPFPEGAFDVVVSTSVLEHALDKEACFAEIHRVLRAGGVALHVYPGKWYLPSEPHTYVPLLNWLWPHCPRAWLALWAILGVRNEFQRGLAWRDVIARNTAYCHDGLSYWTTGAYRELSRSVFGNATWPMAFYVEHAPGGVAAIGRRIRAATAVGALSREMRMAFLVQRKA